MYASDDKNPRREMEVNESHFMAQGTPFQQKVWAALRTIPRGEVRTYTDIAVQIGHPSSARAVANACGKNPYAPEVPCHRVIRSDGSIGGYSAEGGSEKKRAMLREEGVHID
jgi:methylated-DNA-[protein]-cysteine S-methyltransferase